MGISSNRLRKQMRTIRKNKCSGRGKRSWYLHCLEYSAIFEMTTDPCKGEHMGILKSGKLMNLKWNGYLHKMGYPINKWNTNSKWDMSFYQAGNSVSSQFILHLSGSLHFFL